MFATFDVSVPNSDDKTQLCWSDQAAKGCNGLHQYSTAKTSERSFLCKDLILGKLKGRNFVKESDIFKLSSGKHNQSKHPSKKKVFFKNEKEN